MRLIELFGRRPQHQPAPDGEICTIIENPPADAEWRRVRPCVEGSPIRAWRAEADRDVETEHGSVRARGGQDMILACADGTHDVVRREIFDRTFEGVGGGLYRKRTDIVLRYFTLDTPAKVKTLDGYRIAEAGDWIVQGVLGELAPVPRAYAERKYQTV